jgi:hypothetical protein
VDDEGISTTRSEGVIYSANMKSRRRRRTSKPVTVIAAERNERDAPEADIGDDPDQNIDPDDAAKEAGDEGTHQDFRTLVDALSVEPQSLGDLRRRSNLQPTLVGRLVQRFPDLFASYEQAGRPFVRLRVSALDAILDFVQKRAPEFGELSARVSSSEAIAPRKDRNALAEAKAKLEAAKNRLVHLLEFARFSNFLADHGFPMELVREINLQWPTLLVIRDNELGQKHEWLISLAGSEQGEASDAAPIVQTLSAPVQAVNLNFSDADRRAMVWKPHAAKSRRVGTPTAASINRVRNPLVSL